MEVQQQERLVMETEFMSHLMEKTVTLSEDEALAIGTLMDCMRATELAFKKAMPALEKVADPYE
jgi:hypothetical protein